MPGFLPFDASDVPEVRLAEANTEHRLTIEEAEYVEEKFYICCILRFEDELTEDIYYYVTLPKPDDTPRKTLAKQRRVKEFLEAFGIPLDFANVEEFIGKAAWALIDIEEDVRYGRKNRVKRFLGSA